MKQILAVVVLSGVFIAQIAVAGENLEALANPQASLESAATSETLPALPRGNSTTVGGRITSIDNVRDEITLKVFGQRPTKILFDERTQVYRDGLRIPLRDLSTTNHASVQTLLDGTYVFALSIHILSKSPEGEFQGTVLNYNPETKMLTVAAIQLSDPIRLLLPASTQILRKGQGQFTSVSSGASDLVRGTLVAVTFGSDKEGRGVASQVAILATPGSTFVFSGNLSSLDMRTGLLVVVDPRDDKSYQIFFDPARLSTSQHLHQGVHITVVATYDGTRYFASKLSFD